MLKEPETGETGLDPPSVPVFIHSTFPSKSIFLYSVIHLYQLPSSKISTSVLAPPSLVTEPYIYRCLSEGDGCIRWLLYSSGLTASIMRDLWPSLGFVSET